MRRRPLRRRLLWLLLWLRRGHLARKQRGHQRVRLLQLLCGDLCGGRPARGIGRVLDVAAWGGCGSRVLPWVGGKSARLGRRPRLRRRHRRRRGLRRRRLRRRRGRRRRRRRRRVWAESRADGVAVVRGLTQIRVSDASDEREGGLALLPAALCRRVLGAERSECRSDDPRAAVPVRPVVHFLWVGERARRREGGCV